MHRALTKCSKCRLLSRPLPQFCNQGYVIIGIVTNLEKREFLDSLDRNFHQSRTALKYAAGDIPHRNDNKGQPALGELPPAALPALALMPKKHLIVPSCDRNNLAHKMLLSPCRNHPLEVPASSNEDRLIPELLEILMICGES